MPEPRTAGALTPEERDEIKARWATFARGRVFVGGISDALRDIRRLLAALAHAERERVEAQKLAVEVEEGLMAEMHVVARDSGAYRACSDLLRALYREVVRKRLAAAPPPAEGGER